jgi:beta-glucosidase
MTNVASNRIERLIGQMTVEEKIGQLNMLTAGLVITGPGDPADYMAALRAGQLGSLFNLFGAEELRKVQKVAVEETRLGIPLIFGYDIIHGHRTIFPIPLGEAAAFDPGLWERTARIAALEGAAEGLNMTFAPMLDVSRDPRWGRIAESAGEDTWLTTHFAAAKIKGFQGASLSEPTSLAAVPKHLAAYGAAMAGRDYAQTEVSNRSFHEVYLPPFRKSVEMGAAALMPAFTDFNGVPMTANGALLRDLVRGSWGFDGVMVSDYNAVAELVPHGVAEGIPEAAALALKAGVDIDMMGHAYTRGLPVALQAGLVAESDIDASVRRVLNLKERLGLFDDPYRPYTLTAQQHAEHRHAALDAARRSIVLMTDRGKLLPVKHAPRRIAVLGPLADAKEEMLGPWSGAGRFEDMVTFLAGIKDAWPHSEILHTMGVPIEGGDSSNIAAALDMARASDLVILCLGEARWMSGEAGSRARPVLPGLQREFAEAVFATGKPVIVLLSCGRPLAVSWLFERAGVVLLTWYLGSEAGRAAADVLTGQWNPSARLPVTWPVDIGQIPIFYNRLPTGRPFDAAFRYSSKYLDMPNEPLFSFGHGLSYANFTYHDLRIFPSELKPGDTLTVEVDVANEGSQAGEETVLLFTRDPVASVSRPLLELKAMTKLALAPRKVETARLTLATDDLTFLGHDLEPKLEPGIIELFVGPAAREDRLLKARARIVLDHA